FMERLHSFVIFVAIRSNVSARNRYWNRECNKILTFLSVLAAKDMGYKKATVGAVAYEIELRCR
ncbi:hypothetical protein KIV40_05560, partial [Vibrio sp. D173a]|uniref:hypothetical protein n=1 Tax=Vibrio sp. D173a TaxID=2836349 RepID=UPI00255469E0